MKQQSEEHHKAYIRQLIYENNIIEAIKYIHDLTGMGLKESKELCSIFMNDLTKLDDFSFFENSEEIQNEYSEFDIQGSEQEVIDNIKIMLQRGEKLLAVKFAREILNIDLKEAKAVVERIADELSNAEQTISHDNDTILFEQAAVIEENEQNEEQTEIEAISKIKSADTNPEKKQSKKKSYKSNYEPITFGKTAERDKLKKRKRSNSGCMVTLTVIFIIALSITGTILFF